MTLFSFANMITCLSNLLGQPREVYQPQNEIATLPSVAHDDRIEGNSTEKQKGAACADSLAKPSCDFDWSVPI